MYVAGQLLTSLLCAFAAKDWSAQILLNFLGGSFWLSGWGQYLISTIILGSQPSSTEVGKLDSQYTAPGNYQIWSSKLDRKVDKQQSHQVLLGNKSQSSILFQFACLLQQSCAQDDPSLSHTSGSGLPITSILLSCSQRVLLHTRLVAESTLQSDLKLMIHPRESPGFAVQWNIKSW